MDYRELLVKFLAHVIQVEDSDLIELINTPFSTIRFSEDEISQLRELIHEVAADKAEHFH